MYIPKYTHIYIPTYDVDPTKKVFKRIPTLIPFA